MVLVEAIRAAITGKSWARLKISAKLFSFPEQ